MSHDTTLPARRGAAAGAVLSPPKVRAVPALAPRLPLRVLQSGRAPAQLSLFQGLGPR